MTLAPVHQTAFESPAGFIDRPTAVAVPTERTIFIARPEPEAENHCTYLVDDDTRIYLPNTVRCFLNSVEIIDVSYDDDGFQPQQKLLVHMTTTAGDEYCYRVGALSYAASSLLIALCQMNSTAIGGEIELSWTQKGAAIFARIFTATGSNYTSVNVPHELLGKKLDLDQMSEALVFINSSIQSGDCVPPVFFTNN